MKGMDIPRVSLSVNRKTFGPHFLQMIRKGLVYENTRKGPTVYQALATVLPKAHHPLRTRSYFVSIWQKEISRLRELKQHS